MDTIQIYFKGKLLAQATSNRSRVFFLDLEYRDSLSFAEAVYAVYFDPNRSNCSEASHRDAPGL